MKKKVLIIQEYIPHYRIPLFTALNDFCDITITSASEKDHNATFGFKVIPISLTKKNGFWIYNPVNGKIDYNSYDTIIMIFNIRLLNIIIRLFSFSRKYKIILWGIGVGTENGFDSNKNLDWIRYLFAKKADALLFYSEYPKRKYANHGVQPEKMFVANNTLDIEPFISEEEKEYFLFIGSIIPYKKIKELIEVFHKSLPLLPDNISLRIVGDGSLLEETIRYVEELKIEKRVLFLGRIENNDVLRKVYSKAIASISPNQAGLSVLQSMANGVPFITKEKAITGGELFNIDNCKNGILYKHEDDLIEIIVQLANDPNRQKTLATNAYNHFKQNRSMKKMVSGFIDAINYVEKQNT